MSQSINQKFLSKLRFISLIEGCSTLILFGVAMPLKYFANFPLAVKIAGPIHGILFLALVLMFCLALRKVPIGFLWSLAGITAAIVPFGPFVMDIYLGKLAQVKKAT